jgi:long-chain fatty acid transport protein
MRTFVRSILGGCAALLAVVATRDASAAGFAAAHFGGEHGNPVTTNPTALYFNPAGIAFSDSTIDFFVDGELAMRNATWSHTTDPPQAGNASLSPQASIGNTGDAHLFNVFGGPALGATIKVHNFAFGAGFFVPFGGTVSWDKNSSFSENSTPVGMVMPSGATCGGNQVCPLAADGVQRWHAIDASLHFIYGTAGAAYKFGPLGIGASFNLINSSIQLKQAHTLGGQIDSTVENRGTLDVNGWDVSYGAGAMLEAWKNHLWIGASYQAQPGLGPQQLKGSLKYVAGQAPYYPDTGVTQYDVYFHESLPDIIRAGVKVKPSSDLEFRLFGDMTRWSVMKSQCVNLQRAGTNCQVYPDGSSAKGSTIFANVPRNWNDTFAIRGGTSYWVQPEIEVFGGLGFETAAAPDSTLEPGAMDANNILIAAGARVKVTPLLYVAASYTHLQFLDRDNNGKSQLYVQSTSQPPTNTNYVQVPSLNQDGGGKYTQWIGVFDLNLEAKF